MCVKTSFVSCRWIMLSLWSMHMNLASQATKTTLVLATRRSTELCCERLGIDDDKEPHQDRYCRFQEIEERGLRRRGPVDAPPCYLEGTVLLDTMMRFGRISYEEEDVKVWDRRWQPSETVVRHLSKDWMLRPCEC
ncbi:uncharacterized protein LOC111344646 isoform X2 [Stylophora pistillata]|uniref:uncharacterized protein LOC111344646 isoform X2 n=1 Tax=Stylophora pistillata TaxID=50429 RepID=UPI000C05247F|nr:uncharacterized protein LOC111344646 isoform X2 [Stylophora pistillata]